MGIVVAWGGLRCEWRMEMDGLWLGGRVKSVVVLVGWMLELLVVRCSVGGVEWLVVVAWCRGGVSVGPRGVVMVDVL